MSVRLDPSILNLIAGQFDPPPATFITVIVARRDGTGFDTNISDDKIVPFLRELADNITEAQRQFSFWDAETRCQQKGRVSVVRRVRQGAAAEGVSGPQLTAG